MSTPNFKTQNNFDLYVHSDNDFYFGTCPECGEYFPAGAEQCAVCGADLTGERLEFDDFLANDFYNGVQDELDSINENFTFHKIVLKSGHYTDVQFYVEITDDADSAGFSADNLDDPRYGPDNESCRYYLDMCRSVAIRKYRAEQNKVKKALARLAADFGFIKLACVDIFSNGEAIYAQIA